MERFYRPCLVRRLCRSLLLALIVLGSSAATPAEDPGGLGRRPLGPAGGVVGARAVHGPPAPRAVTDGAEKSAAFAIDLGIGAPERPPLDNLQGDSHD